MNKENKECIACASKEHDWRDCPYLEEKCSKCGDAWHLSKNHEAKNLVANDCNYKYGDYGDDEKPCQYCQSNFGNKQPHCRNDKRCAICLDQKGKCSPYEAILEGDNNKDAWNQDRYKNFCYYWWKMKVSEGEDNKAQGKIIRKSTTTIPSVEGNITNSEKPPSSGWIIGISVVVGIAIGAVSVYFYLRNIINKKNE